MLQTTNQPQRAAALYGRADSAVRMLVACGLGLWLAVGTSISRGEEDRPWNQYRGPHEDGTSLARGLPTQFGEGSPEIVWKTPIHGRGWSSPVVWGNQIWLTTGPEVKVIVDDKRPPDEAFSQQLEQPLPLHAVCVDLTTGKIVHDIPVFQMTSVQITHPTNSYASPTPYVEEGRVFVHFGHYGTACLDTRTGKKIWERTDLKCNHYRGPGSSPIAYKGLLYLTFDGIDQQYLVALNAATGETVWKRNRDIDYGTNDGDAKKAFSTPRVIVVDGREELVSPFCSQTIAYQPETGEPIWRVRHGGMNAAARPLFGNGLVYINTADGPNPLIALDPRGTGDLTDKIAWKATKGVPRRSSQLLIGDLLFMMSDDSIASCLDAKTGKELWVKRLGGNFWSSPIFAEGNIYCCAQEGDDHLGRVVVFKAAREFELVADNKLGTGFNSTPAVAGKSLILRSKTDLYRVERR